MSNPILLRGLVPHDELYLLRSGPRWRFRAVRHQAVGEVLFTELAPCDDKPKMLGPGDWHKAGPLDLRDWIRYGHVNAEGRFVSVEQEQARPRRAQGEQLALALRESHA